MRLDDVVVISMNNHMVGHRWSRREGQRRSGKYARVTGVGHTSGDPVVLKTSAFHGVKENPTTLALDRVFARVGAAIAFAADGGRRLG